MINNNGNSNNNMSNLEMKRNLNDKCVGGSNSNLFCLVGILIMDLYPQQDWNFVFSQAKVAHGVGILSFARYLPHFDKFVKVNQYNNNNNNGGTISNFWNRCTVSDSQSLSEQKQ